PIQGGSTATSAMKAMSRTTSSRAVHGSRPITRSSPSNGVRPRMALSAVVLPAPLGPMSPRMRPSSTRRLMPSSATFVPKALRRPRASMHAIASALLLKGIRLCRLPRRRIGSRPAVFAIQQFFCGEAQPLNGVVDPRPFFAEKLLPLALKQQSARSGINEHAQAAPRLHQSFVHQLLVALQDRERINPKFGRHIAHGRQRIAFLQHAVQDHRRHAVAKLTVNRLAVVPLTVHQVFPTTLSARDGASPRYPLQVKSAAYRLVTGQHESPVLGVMVGIDDSKHRVVHMSVLAAAGKIAEFEFQRLAA